MAQTKDLRWSRLNPTLYSLYFTGKAKHHIVCSFCLSDLHSSGQCPENPSSASAAVPWFSSSTPGPSRSPSANFQEKLYCLYNAIGGSCCNIENCKFAHKCSACRGQHPRAFCRKVSVASVGPVQDGNRVVKRPRME